MSLNKNLLSKFAKTVKDTKSKTKKETFSRGWIVKKSDGIYVRLDGSDILTPVTVTTNVSVDQPVTVMIKNHSAIVVGNTAQISEVDESNVINPTSNMLAIEIDEINDLWVDYFE